MLQNANDYPILDKEVEYFKHFQQLLIDYYCLGFVLKFSELQFLCKKENL